MIAGDGTWVASVITLLEVEGGEVLLVSVSSITPRGPERQESIHLRWKHKLELSPIL